MKGNRSIYTLIPELLKDYPQVGDNLGWEPILYLEFIGAIITVVLPLGILVNARGWTTAIYPNRAAWNNLVAPRRLSVFQGVRRTIELRNRFQAFRVPIVDDVHIPGKKDGFPVR